MLRACHNDVSDDSNKLPPPTALPPLMVRHQRDLNFLYKQHFFESLLKQAYNLKSNILICMHLSWEDEKRTEWILSMLLPHVAVLQCGILHYVTDVLESLLALEDSIAQWRVALALNYNKNGFLEKIFNLQIDRERRKRDYYASSVVTTTENILALYKFLFKMIATNPLVAGWIKHTAVDFNKLYVPFFEDVILSIQRSFKTIENDNILSQTTRLYNEFKSFLTGQLQVSMNEYPPDFSLNNCPVNQIEERSDEELN